MGNFSTWCAQRTEHSFILDWEGIWSEMLKKQILLYIIYILYNNSNPTIVGFQYREKKLCSVRCAHLQLFSRKSQLIKNIYINNLEDNDFFRNFAVSINEEAKGRAGRLKAQRPRARSKPIDCSEQSLRFIGANASIHRSNLAATPEANRREDRVKNLIN